MSGLIVVRLRRRGSKVLKLISPLEAAALRTTSPVGVALGTANCGAEVRKTVGAAVEMLSIRL
jgi:hypothetical protein